MKKLVLLIFILSSIGPSYTQSPCLIFVEPLSFEKNRGIFSAGIKDYDSINHWLTISTADYRELIDVNEIIKKGKIKVSTPISFKGESIFIDFTYRVRGARVGILEDIQFSEKGTRNLIPIESDALLQEFKKLLQEYSALGHEDQMISVQLGGGELYFPAKLSEKSVELYRAHMVAFFAEFGQNRENQVRDQRRLAGLTYREYQRFWSRIKRENTRAFVWHDRLPKGAGSSPAGILVSIFMGSGVGGLLASKYKKEKKPYEFTHAVNFYNAKDEKLSLLVLEEKDPNYDVDKEGSFPFIYTFYYPDDGKLWPIVDGKVTLYQFFEIEENGQKVEKKIPVGFSVSFKEDLEILRDDTKSTVFELKKLQ